MDERNTATPTSTRAPRARRKTALSEATDDVQVEAIERRAYEIYLERGRDDGHALDDWLRAEAELHTKGH
jgi:hypothetical protein